MDKQALLRKIMGASDEIRRLQQDIIALQSIDIVNYPENYSSLSQQAAIRCEFITHKLRELVYGTTNIPKADYLKYATDNMGICISCSDDGIIGITIPCFIPHRRKKQTGLITEPLFAALAQFISSQSPELPFERFNHCVICINHVYDKAMFEKGHKRDHDNIEIKGIIDVINTFLLTDDNGCLCDIYSTSELDSRDYTQISVMKKDMFPEWVQRHKKQLFSLS